MAACPVQVPQPMWPLAAAVVALVAARWSAPRLADLLGTAGLVRENWRGRRVVTGLGVTLVAAGAAGMAAAGWSAGPWPVAFAGYGAVAGAALFGMLDDVLRGTGGRGWSAHVGGLLSGRWTGGSAKLVGIGAAAMAAGAWCAGGPAPGWVLAPAAGLVIAGTANAVNLLDTRPGRALKLWFLLALAVGLGGSSAASAWLLPWAAAGLALLPLDLAEQAMLGDTGANALGAALGVGIVLGLGDAAALWGAALLLALVQALGDRRSLGAWIERWPPLGAVDALGRWQGPPEGNLPQARE